MNTEPLKLVVVSAGTSDPSSTRLLADRTAERAVALAARHGNKTTTSVIELREIAADISTALVSQLITPKLKQAITTLGEADGIIAAAPVYKAGPSGLFTSFFGVLDNDLLIAKPVVLAATAGTARHALVADEAMRPMFAYLRTGGLERPGPGHPHRPRRARARTADGERFRPGHQGRILAELPARIRQRGWHADRHRPRHRPHAPRDRRLRRITPANAG
jgi:NAD(P)H-dependent FMN reductase